ncbi:uncharacterized protein N7511_006771 [Penicillium nucicola]|uniref:uncharacterized protein n=1 Tax=Penicillium nucicola TaxID=1850975 RepID=UPI00254512F3|nr:uncharacterized protein N7511_006771 [Penicillium nucicola]KAJ5758077.1 hypothetical protein N7511_006771 [Penicillium nucicola]
MRYTTCNLPNGLTFTVSPVFGGVTFKSTDFNVQQNPTFPPGWTIIIHTEKPQNVTKVPGADSERGSDDDNTIRFTTPTLNRDSLYISYIVNPPSSEFKPVTSPTRQIAMMLWATMWWYFHEPEPDLHLETAASSMTPNCGRPKGDWRINIKREGIFKGRNLLQKLERMGLITTQDSSVGLQPMETRDSSSWSNMFVSRRSFWQLDPRLFLFTLTPRAPGSPSPSVTPYESRQSSPTPGSLPSSTTLTPTEAKFHTANAGCFTSAGPFTSGSHLPTYYPPAPTQYTYTHGVRHPMRPKPPHQGEVFYVRYIPSVSQYISFRIPFVPMTKTIPVPVQDGSRNISGSRPGTPVTSSVTSIEQHLSANVSSDVDTLHRWMNVPRVEAMWSEGGPKSAQEKFLLANLTSKHKFPVIGCWDGMPFGYFEIYWVKEDPLGRLLDRVDNYDRGIHLLVGEQEFRGAHRVAIWLSALVHHCFLADMRTEAVYLEPRVDNIKYVSPSILFEMLRLGMLTFSSFFSLRLINYLQEAGFYKEGEVSFPHKQSAVMKIKREFWEAPAL